MKKAKSFSFNDAIKVSLRYIKFKPRTEFEVRNKLKMMGFPHNVIDEAINFLNENDIIDDERFIREWVKERFFIKGFGREKIYQELKAKGLSKELVDEIISEVLAGEDEVENALRFLEMKFKKLSDKSSLKSEKIVSLLLRNGYKYDTALKVTKDFLSRD